MNLTHLAALFQALADKATELAENENATRDEREEQREIARREQTAGDIESVVAIVQARPGIASGELSAALVREGLAIGRAKLAISASLHAGRVETMTAQHRSIQHFLAGKVPTTEMKS